MEVSYTTVALRVARSDETDLVREALRRIYYPHAPVRISYIHGKEPTLEDEQFTLSFVRQGSVVLAEDSNTRSVVGISIGGPIQQGDPELMLEKAKTTATKKWSDILKLFASIERSADVCGRYGIGRAYHVHILAVDPARRRQSLGLRLMRFQMELARKFGYGAISADFTSVYSARIAEKLGMECIGQMALDEYRDEKGDKLFEPQDIHKLVKTCVTVFE